MASKTLKISGSLLAIFLVAYFGAHFYIRWSNTVTDDVTKKSRLVECHPNDLREIKIHQVDAGKSRVLEFSRIDKPEPGVPAVTALARWEWKYIQPLKGEAEPVLLRRIAATICELYDPVPLGESDMQPDGRNFAHAEVLEATLSGGAEPEKIAFEFGAVAADHSNVVRFHGRRGERVVRIADSLQQASSRPAEDFLNLRVMRLEADNVQRATLKVDGTEHFTLERAGADWKVLLGEKEKGAGSDEAGRFVNRISTLRALAVLVSDYSPKECRESRAKAELFLRGLAGREEVLRFSYGKKGDVEACSSARSAKFKVHHDLVKYLEMPLKALLTK